MKRMRSPLAVLANRHRGWIKGFTASLAVLAMLAGVAGAGSIAYADEVAPKDGGAVVESVDDRTSVEQQNEVDATEGGVAESGTTEDDASGTDDSERATSDGSPQERSDEQQSQQTENQPGTEEQPGVRQPSAGSDGLSSAGDAPVQSDDGKDDAGQSGADDTTGDIADAESDGNTDDKESDGKDGEAADKEDGSDDEGAKTDEGKDADDMADGHIMRERFTFNRKTVMRAAANETVPAPDHTKSIVYNGGGINYDATGDEGTGETSAGKRGFRSNAAAQVCYTFDRQSDCAVYQHPVLQVPSADAMPGEYDGDPAAFAATKTGNTDAAWFRSFAGALAIGTGVTADGTVIGNGESATISPLEEGWYLITDVDKDGNRGINAIVATTLGGVADTFTVKGDPATGQGKIDAVGAFVAKNEDKPEQPDKTADQTTTADGVGIGQAITYTIALDIPAAAEGYDTYPYFVKDVASKGLTVNKDFSAKIGSTDVPFTYVTEPTVDTDGNTTTLLEFDLAGKSGHLVITYTAVVNKDIIAMDGKVSNTASVSRDGEAWIPPVEFDSYTGGFDFRKYGVGNDADGLAGATFNVFEGSALSKTPLRFVRTGEGVYRLAEADEQGDEVSADVVTTTGNVRITGLKSGEYTLKEIGFVKGYAKNFVPTFTVKLEIDQETGASTFKLVGDNNLGLASMDEKLQVIQVKNVKNITQLPLTGAAGTALFTIVALVMAGAGLALVFRFREPDTKETV